MSFPEPRLPVHPVLSLQSFRGRRSAKIPSLFDIGSAVLFTSGRYGLARALQLAGVEANDEVLIPAYCCPAMVAPVRWLGAIPVFFRLDRDLCADVEDLRRRVSTRTKCIVVVHYFGFVRELTAIRQICDAHGLKLIEDCAHSFFGRLREIPVGARGDFAFASLMKFFPLFDGGCLVSSRALEVGARPKRGGVGFQAKSLVNVLERSHEYGRLPFRGAWSALFAAKDWVWSAAKPEVAMSRPMIPSSLEGGYEFEAQWSGIGMSWFSAAVMAHVSEERVVDRRRFNYSYLLKRCGETPGCRALYPTLPENIVPYMFPLFVERPATVFRALKSRGVPLLRWEDAVKSICSVSDLYSEHLFLLPCHQELSPENMEWVCAEVQRALTSLTSKWLGENAAEDRGQ